MMGREEHTAGGAPAGMIERRRVQRVKMATPLRGVVGSARMFVVDVSLRGLRIAHQEAIGRPGEVVNLKFDWDGHSVSLRCEITRSQTVRAADGSGKPLIHSGLVIVHAAGSSGRSLRDLVEWHIVRALDEQKANARGIPAVAPQSFQTGKATYYIRHELVLGRWREMATTDPTQPSQGFTVSAEHSASEVEMLRSAFERGTSAGGRDLIRRLAQLSISAAEGIPTRRFMP